MSNREKRLIFATARAMPRRLTIGAGPDTIGPIKPIAAAGLYGLSAVEELL
jgi:hypothetical protein